MVNKILTSTLDTQGMRKNDFSWTLGAEILHFGTECDGEKIDGKCGCRRSMTGIESLKSTTTMKVVNTTIHPNTIAAEIAKSDIKAGWYPDTSEGNKEALAAAMQEVKELMRIAGAFKTGSILEKRGKTFAVRKIYPAYAELTLEENPNPKDGRGKFSLRG